MTDTLSSRSTKLMKSSAGVREKSGLAGGGFSSAVRERQGGVLWFFMLPVSQILHLARLALPPPHASGEQRLARISRRRAAAPVRNAREQDFRSAS